ncbi:MAG TPA: FAD-dependent oxidoreductase [Candidatus Kapabacteria bacterium]|nr:FAD-dependent oxidoreductase [Candidatus Kapabacteria bacterium]
MKKVLIIGGMAAGCKSAARLSRLSNEFDITIIEKSSFLSYGTCGMPFYASGDVDDFFDLAKTPYGLIRNEEYFLDVKNVKTILNTAVLAINTETKSVHCKNLQNNDELNLDYDYLVIATGATPVLPQFPFPDSEKISFFHNPLDAKKFREKAQRGEIEKVAIIGAGLIGCELAEAMVSLWGIETYLIERENRLLPKIFDNDFAEFTSKLFSNQRINLELSSSVERIEIDKKQNLIIHLSNGKAVGCNYAFICLGVKPNVELARAIGVNIGNFGGILVNEKLQTNIADVYAAGDCTQLNNLITKKQDYFPLGSLANRQGKVLADNIFGIDSKFQGAVGTCSIKVFNQIFASSGLTEERSKQFDYNVASVVISSYDRPDYHPDVNDLISKLIYDRSTYKILGLQMTGSGEVTRYIDSFSVFCQNGAGLYDLLEFEHSYTPTHSSPLNPLNNLASIALMQEENNLICFPANLLNKFSGVIIDLREQAEIQAEPLPVHAIEISITNIRDKINEFDKREEILLICQRGPRSFEVGCYFMQNGFKNVFYLGGGVHLLNDK